jgi:catechol 2,3-dioxygenase-like lactoylglutathione lyase family enzyme
MPVELNHTIVYAEDKRKSAEFLAGILGIPVGEAWGLFVPVELSNSVTLDFADAPAGSVSPQHYAFRISDEEFDAAFERLLRAGISYYADPHHSREGELNNYFGGRGLYFLDPAGHNMEIGTRV